MESNHVWNRYATQSQGENVQDRVYLYNQHSFVCVGANRAPGYWDGAMVRTVRYRGNVVVGYGGFGVGDHSTDILLEGNTNVNATLPDFIGANTSNVMVNCIKTEDSSIENDSSSLENDDFGGDQVLNHTANASHLPTCGFGAAAVSDICLIAEKVRLREQLDAEIAQLLAKSVKTDDEHTASPTLLGSYPHLLKNSATNLSSDNDILASVTEAKRTGQTLMGSFVDECFYYDQLRPLLEATTGTGISVFGMLRSHNGPIYCPAVFGNTDGKSPASGQEQNWTRVATTLATLSAEFPHFAGYTIDDFYCMMDDPESPGSGESTGEKLSVSTMADAHVAMKRINPAFKFLPTVYPGYLGVYAGSR